jgi:outer membrane protein assembly factor BamB
MVVSCASIRNRSKSKPDKPMALQEINTTLKVNRLWNAGVKSDRKLRLGLGAAADADTIYIAGSRGDIEALAATTGKQKWKRTIKVQLAGGPGVGAGMVVVGGSKGDVIALSAADGAQRWRVRLNSEVLSAPAVSSDEVIVRTADGKLYALESKDGSQRWVTDQQLPRLTLRGNAPPAISGDMVLAGFDNGRLIAVTRTGGATVWDTAVGQARGSSELQRLVDIDSGVAIDGDDVFVVSFQGRVARIARDTGTLIWAKDLSSYRGLAVNGTAVFISTAAGELVKLDRSSGAQEWKQESLLRRQLSGPAVVGDYVVLADFDGVVHWLNASDGRVVARTKVGKRVSLAPITASGLVIVSDDEGGISAFKLPAATQPSG